MENKTHFSKAFEENIFFVESKYIVLMSLFEVMFLMRSKVCLSSFVETFLLQQAKYILIKKQSENKEALFKSSKVNLDCFEDTYFLYLEECNSLVTFRNCIPNRNLIDRYVLHVKVNFGKDVLHRNKLHLSILQKICSVQKV